jgi:His/Glu/Gln/Arg/opine family amino acid ABC transporter permease subunit
MAETVTEARLAPNQWSMVRIPLQILGTALFVVLIPLALGMQWANFTPLFQPSALRFLGVGVVVTIVVALVSILVSLPLATALALGRLARQWAIRWLCIVFVEVIRSLPLLLLIFYINLRFPGLGIFEGRIGGSGFLTLVLTTISSRGGLAMILSLTLYTAAVNAELLRAGILSLERGQTEAARSLGLSYWQTMRLVILPQAYRRILAPLIAQFTILLKDTSLGAIIGFIELQRRAQILYQRDFNPMEALYLVALIYFVLNYLLGLSSKFVERTRPTVHVQLQDT